MSAYANLRYAELRARLYAPRTLSAPQEQADSNFLTGVRSSAIGKRGVWMSRCPFISMKERIQWAYWRDNSGPPPPVIFNGHNYI